jgi:hypothetical protein
MKYSTRKIIDYPSGRVFYSSLLVKETIMIIIIQKLLQQLGTGKQVSP